MAGGLIAYSVLNQFATVNLCALSVESAEASVSTDGNVVLTVTFRNIGGKAIASAVLEVEGGTIVCAGEFTPPRTGASFLVGNPPGVWLLGSRKTGVIKATYADGSSASTVFAIPVVGSASVMGRAAHSEHTLISDGFNGLSGWVLWGDEQHFAIEIDDHGKPAPCLHIYGNGPHGVLAGAAKTVQLPPGATALSLSLIFDYNVHAPPSGGSFPGNLRLRMDAEGSTLYDEKVYEAKSADSGWKETSAVVPLPSPAPSSVTLIIYTVDQSDRVQEFWLDNVFLNA